MTSNNLNKLIPRLTRKVLTMTFTSAAVCVSFIPTAQAQSTVIATSTICQAQSTASWCSNQPPGPLVNGYRSLTWTNLNKKLTEITVANDMAWGIDSNSDLWQLPDFKSGTAWTKVAAGVKKIVSNGSLLCQINSNTYIYCSTSLMPPSTADANGYHSLRWIKTTINTLSTIALGGGNKIWGTDSNRDLYLYNDFTNPIKVTTAQAAANVYKVAANVYEIATDGKILCQKNLSSSFCSNFLVPSTNQDDNGYNALSWTNLGVLYKNLAVADGQVWGVSSTSDVWYMPNYTDNSSWYKIAAGGIKISAASAPSTGAVTNPFASDEVPVLLFMGQSNSAGTNNIPASFNLSNSPNVRGITNMGWTYYPGNGNGTTFTSAISTISSISWSNWTHSSSGVSMNLGFNSGSGNAANFAAHQWQSLINAGNKLPDLHIIHIGWPSQGVDPLDYYDPKAAPWVYHGVNLWQPGLGTSKQPSYALAPFARRILYLALRDIVNSGKVPRIIGMQWNQWEAEANNTTAASNNSATTVANAPGNYAALFKGFYDAAGAHFPIQFVKPLSTAAVFHGYTPAMQNVFSNMVAAAPSDYSIIDVSTVSSSIFSGGSLGGGDGTIHYNLDTHKWFAAQAINTCLVNGKCGTRISPSTLPGTAPN